MMKLVVVFSIVMVVLVNANPLLRFTGQDTYNNQDFLAQNSSNDTALDVLKKMNLTNFVMLIDHAGLTKNFTQAGEITVLAPTQEAILNLPLDVRRSLITNRTFAERFVTYHVLPNNYSISNMTQDRVVTTLLTTSSVRFNVYDVNNTVNGVNLQGTKMPATNGIVYVVGKSLWPITGYNALDQIKRIKTLTTFATKIHEAKMEDTFQGSGPFTIFAPSDEAFKNHNSTKAASVVQYHVVTEPTEYHAGLLNKPSLTTMYKYLGSHKLSIEVGKDGSITVNGGKLSKAKVIATDISVFNGVIHIIDTVLKLPIL